MAQDDLDPETALTEKLFTDGTKMDDLVTYLDNALDPRQPEEKPWFRCNGRTFYQAKTLRKDPAAIANYDALPRPLKPPRRAEQPAPKTLETINTAGETT